jgi:very-short-patch-repair endonuclease
VRLVIEYDGVYRHRDKQEIDARKTVDLIQSGLLVAGLRENDLATPTWTTRTCDSCRAVPTSGASTTSWRGFP